jgi:hypothetical protein
MRKKCVRREEDNTHINFLRILPNDMIQIIMNTMCQSTLNSFLQLNKQTHSFYAMGMVNVWKEHFQATYLTEATMELVDDLKAIPRLYNFVIKLLREQDAIMVDSYVLQFVTRVPVDNVKLNILLRCDQVLDTMTEEERSVYLDDFLRPYFHDYNTLTRNYSNIDFKQSKEIELLTSVPIYVIFEVDSIDIEITFLNLEKEKTIRDIMKGNMIADALKCFFDGESIITDFFFKQFNRKLSYKDLENMRYESEDIEDLIDIYTELGFVIVHDTTNTM